MFAIYVFGAGGGALETLEDVKWVYNCSEMHAPILVFVEDAPTTDSIEFYGETYPLRSLDVVPREGITGHITPFDPDYKEKLDGMFGFDWVTASASTVTGNVDHVGLNVRSGCHIGNTVELGRHVKVNFHTFIGHNSKVGDYSFISHTVGIGAHVTIGRKCQIFEGTVIVPGVTIGDNTTIGAGSVVTKSIPANKVAYGNPCKVVRDDG
jgi:acetyltransferase-like isoleucine patch superfamily enzyme